MTITRTEVLQAIARCEPHAGFATIDNALVHSGAISRGDLLALIEAAKCARYGAISIGTPTAGSDWALDHKEPEPVSAITHDTELDETKEQLHDAKCRVRELECALTDAASTLRRAL
jgi:hypothetical protein